MRLTILTLAFVSSWATGCERAVVEPVPFWGDLGPGPRPSPVDMAQNDLGLTTLTVDIGNGATIEGTTVGSGNEFTIRVAPVAFKAPLHVATVNRLGHPVHNRADLVSACAVPLGVGEAQPTFSGEFLFDPLSQSWLEATILHSGAGKIAGFQSVHVLNAPTITAATSNEPSFADALKFALTGSPHDAQYTSNDWTLLCRAVTTMAPNVTLAISGSFDQKSYAVTIDLDTLALDVK